ncbi:MAG: hypothetical protein IJX95_05510 [Lachnospiraceae bacterium]|nr:hypothetical protein [Lachnospiraceae bacterium]
MDLSEKKTALDDSASIYQKREEKSDRAKWKDLKGFRAKWDHFKAYYLLKTFIWVCVIAFAGYMVYEFFAPEKEKLIYVAVLDTVLMNDVVEELQSGFEEYMGMDETKLDSVFDNTMNVSNTRDAASAEMFTVHAYVGDIDVLIASESLLEQYADYYIRPLSDQLPTDLYDAVTDRFCYVEPVDEEGNKGESQPYGIYITDLVTKSPYCKEEIVLAVCGNTKRGENAEEFVRYLLRRAEGMQKVTVE